MESNLTEEKFPTQPGRLISFVNFFKNYMSISALITACLPIPVASLNLIPTFKDQSGILSVYTTLFCFLVLSFIFYIRHALARVFFPLYFMKDSETIYKKWVKIISKLTGLILPLLFIGLSMQCILLYHKQLNSIIGTLKSWAISYDRNNKIKKDLSTQDSILYKKDKFAIDSIKIIISNNESILLQHQHDTLVQRKINKKLIDLNNALTHYNRRSMRSRDFFQGSFYTASDVANILPVDTTKELSRTISQNFILDNLSTPSYMFLAKNKSPDFQAYFTRLDYLMINYFGIFLFAEIAFILMAIKEYLQDYLKLSDRELMS